MEAVTDVFSELDLPQNSVLCEVNSGITDQPYWNNTSLAGKKFGLSQLQVQFALAYFACQYDVRSAAKKTGISVVQGTAWIKNPRFLKYIEIELVSEFKRRLILNIPAIIEQIQENAQGDFIPLLEAFQITDPDERIVALRKLPKKTLGRVAGWAYDRAGRLVPKLVSPAPMLELLARLSDASISAQLGNSKTGNAGASPVSINIISAVPERTPAIEITAEVTNGD